MAKDPAVLFYFDHWRGGTMTMSRFLKGAYMDLLDAQFNNGHLLLEEIKTVLGTDFSAWGSLSKKFAVDETGKYFNKRLDLEIKKRSDYSESRSKNRKSNHMSDHMIDHMSGHMVNINVNRNVNKDEERGVGKGEGFFVNELPMETELIRVEISAVKGFINAAIQKKITDEDVKRYWEAFKIDNFKKREWKNSREDLLSHFRHTLKNQLLKQTQIKPNGSSKTGKAAGAHQLLEELRADHRNEQG